MTSSVLLALPNRFSFLTAVIVGLASGAAAAALAEEPAATGPKFDAKSLEFFEKQVRPILVERCYECHSVQSKKLGGGLQLDSRTAAIRGGDTGPAVVAGDLAESLLIDAINYGELYEMPPKSKLSPKEIATLTKWVKLNAPWPNEKVAASQRETLDIKERMGEHWAWNSLSDPKQPAVKNANWPSDPLDYFILARLEQAGLTPASDADKITLIRRVYFDLIGLPPKPEEVASFLQDQSPKSYERVVNRLLESPQFGERWARHWLDLVRYSESRGHEFDYSTPNAFQYRDYVIRAINADVPYDQFVTEHIAGDLLKKPRTRPGTGANESVLATGFWYMGEWVHSPVDIRKDETDRFDNMVDVFSKTFLGLTVACARCHDHKFDAISQRDYYALFGYLQSSSYGQTRFETLAHNRQLALEAKTLRSKLGRQVLESGLSLDASQWEQMKLYLAGAIEVSNTPVAPNEDPDIVFEDFEHGTYRDWTAEGSAFTGSPQDATSIAKYQGNVNAKGKFFLNSHNVRRTTTEEARHTDQLTGRLTSSEFQINRNTITFLVGGGNHMGRTCVNLIVDGKRVRTSTGRSNNRMEPARWAVGEFVGRQARIEIVDDHQGGWGNIGVDHIVFTNQLDEQGQADPAVLAAVAEKRKLNGAQLAAWTHELFAAKVDRFHPLRTAAILATSKAGRTKHRQSVATELKRAPGVPADVEIVADYRDPASRFLQDGVTFGAAPILSGDVWVDGADVTINRQAAARRSSLFRKLRLAPGAEKDAGRLAKYDRAGKTLRTATFVLKPERVFYLVRGRGLAYGVVDSHRMINGPLHGALIREFDTKEKFEWVEHNLSRYAGHDLHMEFVPLGEESLDVAMVVQAGKKPDFRPAEWDAKDLQLFDDSVAGDSSAVIDQSIAALRGSAVATLGENATARDLARSAWLLERHELLPAERAKQAEDTKAQLTGAMKKLAEEVRQESQTAPAMWDGTAANETLLIRGNNRTPGDIVPRRFLTAMSGQTPDVAGSGRLELARELLRSDNPFPSRVIVNRIWGHLTGRGIAPDPDNLGVLGQRPTHPELLDHLASRFVAGGWSIKKIIQTIVTSRTYRMTSKPSLANSETDPNNELLHRMRVRRLEAEAIRDSILALSGQMAPKMFGPSVPVHLTSFMQGRGRPRSGPLNGDGRRSIYVSIRRNFLSPMMLAFDAPQPFSTVGRRTVSNVPAQALILMNDPMIGEQAEHWAAKILAEGPEKTEERVHQLYLQAFSRPPTDHEVAAAVQFLNTQADDLKLPAKSRMEDKRLWAEFCHVLINLKEFIFLR